MDAAERTLRALVSRMDPGGFSPQRPTFTGTSRSFAFTTTLQAAADMLATREADVTLAVDGNHQMELLWLPHYRNRTGPLPQPDRAVLRQDVDHLEIAYWRTPQTGWQPDWVERTLPKLIRIKIVSTRSGSHPADPGADIVIAPMRDRWRQ